MTAKRWFVILILAILLAAGLLAGVNMIVDPFSVFGDRVYSWYSYGMTKNPKAAKFDYTNNRRGEFDAFIIGPSGASSICPTVLEQYTGLRWYNMFNYGADLDYTQRLIEHVVVTHQPKEIMLVLPIVSARSYARPPRDLNTVQPLVPFWRMQFVFANPEYSWSKLRLLDSRSYVQQGFDVFESDTGIYDKSRRDAEAIGSMEEYLASNSIFVNPWFRVVRLDDIDECVTAVAEIVEFCRQHGTKLTITTTPMLAQNITIYDSDEVLDFYERIAEISDFWEFSVSSVSHDIRYFYDTTHFRNCVGDMMLARMYGDESVYVPDDFGMIVTRENAALAGEIFAKSERIPESAPAHTVDVPVLRYQNIGEGAGDDATVTPQLFEEHMRALSEAGYTAVSVADIRDYVEKGRDLPEKPVVITIDGGYMSAYTEAFPVLREYGFNAALFPIGALFSRDAGAAGTGGAAGASSLRHFGEDEALEMTRSGLITIQSLSYDMYGEGNADNTVRKGVLRMRGEPEEDYLAAFRTDFRLMSDLLRVSAGEDLFAFAYPHGAVSRFSAIILREQGITVTFTMKQGMNTLIKGLPQSLLEMKRFTVTDDMTASDLLENLK